MLDDCLATIDATARALRLGLRAEAGERLARLVDELLRYVATPAGALRTPVLDAVLPALVACQARGDDIAVADLLEHELAPLLESP